MRIAYFDCFSGASGDMILGALVDAGLSLEQLRAELARLKLDHYRLDAQQTAKSGIAGTRVTIEVDQSHHDRHHRHLHDIEAILAASDLHEVVKARSREIFRRLAQAEAKVHKTAVEHIHFHEVGAMDAILDVVGAVAGLAALGVERVYCSPLHVGSGTVRCQHGTLPVPAPATAELIQGTPVYSSGVAGELLTPTGAAILTTLCGDFGRMPAMTVEQTGYGAGSADLPIPNLLRVFIGEASALPGYETDTVAVLETGIDDMNPQIYDHLMARLLELGALDVLLQPVQMKKNRPAVLLTVISAADAVERLADLILRETTTIGLRWRLEQRIKARRKIVQVPTPYGLIRCKVASAGDCPVNVSPEFEDCRQAAAERNVPLKDVIERARSACRAELEASDCGPASNAGSTADEHNRR